MDIETIEKELILIRLNPDYKRCKDCGYYYSVNNSKNFNVRIFKIVISHPHHYHCICCYWGIGNIIFRHKPPISREKLLKEIQKTYAQIYKIDWNEWKTDLLFTGLKTSL